MVRPFRAALARCRDERGVALLATMLAIALMTLIVVDFTSSSALGYHSAANQANEIRAEFLARSGVNVGLALLAQDARQQVQQGPQANGNSNGVPFDALTSVWAMPFPPIPVGGGTASLLIQDEARKFNINKIINYTRRPNGQSAPLGQSGSIGQATADQGQNGMPGGQGPDGLPVGQLDPIAVQQFTRLLVLLNISPGIVPAVIDWLDRDSIDTPNGGAEADYYLTLIPPYEPRNGPMPTIGDLRMIKGVDDATFQRLKNYLTVVPEPTVNANTASPEVLACLEPELAENPRMVAEIIQARSVRPFTSITDVTNLPGVNALAGKLGKDLTTRSNYFTIAGMGTFAGARKIVISVFRRNGNGTANLVSWQED
jgi:general secretion pathway protein K